MLEIVYSTRAGTREVQKHYQINQRCINHQTALPTKLSASHITTPCEESANTQQTTELQQP